MGARAEDTRARSPPRLHCPRYGPNSCECCHKPINQVHQLLAGAYASFEEDKKGRIRPGMLADLVLLDRDITQADTKPHGSMQPRDAARHIWNTRVEATIVGGRLLYQKSHP